MLQNGLAPIAIIHERHLLFMEDRGSAHVRNAVAHRILFHFDILPALRSDFVSLANLNQQSPVLSLNEGELYVNKIIFCGT
jgi:hypothetical protein